MRSDANSTGLPSERPIIEMTIPSVMDPTLAPEGKHSIGLFTQYSPILRNGTDRWSDQDREDYTNKILSQIDEYAPGFKDSGRSTIIGRLLNIARFNRKVRKHVQVFCDF